MIVYVPTSTSDVAVTLSDAMWGLALPPALRGANVTQRLFSTAVDVDGHSWLEVDTECVIPVHAEAEIDGIAPILLGAGLPQGEVDALAALIISNRGGSMNLWEHFPQVFKDAAQESVVLPSKL